MTNKQLSLFEIDDEQLIFSLLNDEFLPNEYFEIEYKSGKDGFPKELWKSYSAFANTNTGIIVIGVQEKKGILNIEGLSDEQVERYKKQFWNECNNPNTVSRNLLRNDDVRVISIKNKKLLVFRIPFASRTERPVYLTRNPLGNTYKRNHEGDYRCTDEEVKRMLADSSAELQRDSLVLEGFTIDDFDKTSVKQFRQLFVSSKPGHPWHVLDDIELFRKIGAYRIDRKTKKEGITLAGLLMFGKSDSIKEQDALPDFFPDFRERLSMDEKIRWTDRICPDGTWENNLFQFYLKVWPKLSSTLPKPFQLNKDERVDESPTHIALREAFINALVHADYSLSGNIIIEIDTEKFMFSNPGTLLVSIYQYYSGGISECRNPALQQMFMLIGRAEKAGSGVDKIMSGWQESHWRRPYLEIENQPDRIKLTLPMFSIIPEAVLNELSTVFDDVSHLTADELTALSFCQIEGSISNQRLQYVLNMHSTDITNLLKKLCSENYLESDNNGRWTIYKIKQKVDTSLTEVDTSILDVDIQGANNTKVDTLNTKVDTLNTKVDTSDNKVATRYTKDELELLIMKVCKHDYLKMDEVANQIGKSVDYLKNKVFPRMIKNEKLIKRFPFTHNHPEQGYKTNEEYAKQL
ncbi:MAG: putative DNA binding domain-containing protein [Rikenellaceae bacterium]|nr:putative DNA binding domain-containing protein [Rikenellaceae bacterium]